MALFLLVAVAQRVAGSSTARHCTTQSTHDETLVSPRFYWGVQSKVKISIAGHMRYSGYPVDALPTRARHGAGHKKIQRNTLELSFYSSLYHEVKHSAKRLGEEDRVTPYQSRHPGNGSSWKVSNTGRGSAARGVEIDVVSVASMHHWLMTALPSIHKTCLFSCRVKSIQIRTSRSRVSTSQFGTCSLSCNVSPMFSDCVTPAGWVSGIAEVWIVLDFSCASRRDDWHPEEWSPPLLSYL